MMDYELRKKRSHFSEYKCGSNDQSKQSNDNKKKINRRIKPDELLNHNKKTWSLFAILGH
jgi:hypothetical protein